MNVNDHDVADMRDAFLESASEFSTVVGKTTALVSAYVDGIKAILALEVDDGETAQRVRDLTAAYELAQDTITPR